MDRYDSQYQSGRYLNNHLWKKGGLRILDKTWEKSPVYRGHGIQSYLTEHPEVINWVVIDDEIFKDYDIENIMPHLVKTDGNLGLTENDAAAAIKILKGDIH